MYRVEYWDVILNEYAIKSFDFLEQAVEFAHENGGVILN